jgi:hypothetical protein
LTIGCRNEEDISTGWSGEKPRGHDNDSSMTILALLAALALSPAAPHPPAPAPAPVPYGTISICNTAGSRPLSGTLAFTLAAPASAGGTQTMNIAVGTCTAAVFYPSGTALNVLENVPSGSAVTSIVAGGSTTLSASSPTAGSATAVIGSGAGTLTFTTNGPSFTPPPPTCKVPNVIGLSLLAAKAQVRKHACTVGVVRHQYSNPFRAGYVLSETPKRGSVLAHGAPVNLVVSRGPRP